MSRYSTVFLDLDGTVFDFKASERESFRAAVAPHCGGREDAYDLYHKINLDLWHAFERKEVSQDMLKILRFERLFEILGQSGVSAEEVNAAYLNELSQSVFMLDGAEDFTRRLAAKYKLVVVTNGIARNQYNRVRLSPISDLISAVATSEEAGAAKPAPGIYELACKRAGISDKSECVMIGDSYTADIAGAFSFSVDAIWFNPDGEQPKGRSPLMTAKTYEEILDFLEA